MEKSIVTYLEACCHFIIDDFNYIFQEREKNYIQNYAISFSEADFVVRLGTPFRSVVRYNMQSKGRDLIIDYKDYCYEVEVKYLRPWIDPKRNTKNKAMWEDTIEKPIKWLCDENKSDSIRGKRALVAGWFTAFEWKDLLQLGEYHTGGNPVIRLDRKAFLPFINYDSKNPRVASLKTIYTEYGYKDRTIEGTDLMVNCKVVGTKDDWFNAVIYW